MDIMIRLHSVILATACLLILGKAEFLIKIIPDKVEIGITEQLTMECSFVSSDTDLRSVTRVRILKEQVPDDFEIVAEVRDFETGAENIGLGPNANVTGFAGDIASSYIAVNWSLVTSSVLGSYRCDVVGFKENQDVAIERTPVFVLRNSNITIMDVIDLTNKQREELEQELQAQKVYCDSRIATVEADVDAQISALKLDQDNVLKAIEANLLGQLDGLTKDVERLVETGVIQYWPQGMYALLTPDSGCPNNVGALWNPGYSLFHTESTDRNYDQISSPSHLMQPVLQRVNINNFMYQHFCVSNVLSSGADWPTGAYCINRVGGACPNGFNTGSTTWQDEITDSHANISGLVPDGVYTANRTTIFYCCRNDGLANEPVYLPKSRPFYLYRYNGTCQEVVGMQSNPEYQIFDTDTSNQDSYDNGFHPDGAINNVQIQLCYYNEK